jgi:hypothetical protein
MLPRMREQLDAIQQALDSAGGVTTIAAEARDRIL